MDCTEPPGKHHIEPSWKCRQHSTLNQAFCTHCNPIYNVSYNWRDRQRNRDKRHAQTYSNTPIRAVHAQDDHRKWMCSDRPLAAPVATQVQLSLGGGSTRKGRAQGPPAAALTRLCTVAEGSTLKFASLLLVSAEPGQEQRAPLLQACAQASERNTRSNAAPTLCPACSMAAASLAGRPKPNAATARRTRSLCPRQVSVTQTQSPGLAGWPPQAPGGSVASPTHTAAAIAHPGKSAGLAGGAGRRGAPLQRARCAAAAGAKSGTAARLGRPGRRGA